MPDFEILSHSLSKNCLETLIEYRNQNSTINGKMIAVAGAAGSALLGLIESVARVALGILTLPLAIGGGIAISMNIFLGIPESLATIGLAIHFLFTQKSSTQKNAPSTSPVNIIPPAKGSLEEIEEMISPDIITRDQAWSILQRVDAFIDSQNKASLQSETVRLASIVGKGRVFLHGSQDEWDFVNREDVYVYFGHNLTTPAFENLVGPPGYAFKQINNDANNFSKYIKSYPDHSLRVVSGILKYILKTYSNH